MLVFLRYEYNVKTCMYTISQLYQIVRFNVSTWYLTKDEKCREKLALLKGIVTVTVNS